MTCTEKSAGTFNEDQLEIIHTDQAIAKPLAQLIDTDTVYTNSGYDIGKEGATQEMGKDQGELLRPPETDDYELFKKSLKSFVQGTGSNSQGGQTTYHLQNHLDHLNHLIQAVIPWTLCLLRRSRIYTLTVTQT